MVRRSSRSIKDIKLRKLARWSTCQGTIGIAYVLRSVAYTHRCAHRVRWLACPLQKDIWSDGVVLPKLITSGLVVCLLLCRTPQDLD